MSSSKYFCELGLAAMEAADMAPFSRDCFDSDVMLMVGLQLIDDDCDESKWNCCVCFMASLRLACER